MRNYLRIFLFLTLLFMLSACSVSFGSGSKTNSGSDGGVYKTADKGQTWAQKIYVPFLSGKPASIAPLDVNELIQDPSDPKALYYASTDNGLFYSYDKAESWQFASGLGKIAVTSISIDPKNKCTIYAASSNRLYKSVDCSRTWNQVYFYDDPKTTITQVAVDGYDNLSLYIGDSRGEIFKSSDGGTQWHSLQANFGDTIAKILINSQDTRIVFAATQKRGLFRSMDSGATWEDLKDKFKDFKDYKDYEDLIIPGQGGLVFLVVKANIYKSLDNGYNWTKLQLITPEKGVTVNTMASNPKNADEIYYVTNTTFYRSIDGGNKWSTKKLPTSRAGHKLLIDVEDQNTLYMATRRTKK
jgi:photosystem II stability/assembly factor-like uncharacterized protein